MAVLCRYAVVYLRCRCLASPAAMSNYVLYGTFRGFRDTMCAPAALPSPAHYALVLILASACMAHHQHC